MSDLLVPAVVPVTDRSANPTTVRPHRYLPVAQVVAEPADLPVLYGMGRLDRSGRITEHTIITALGWLPGDPLAYRPLPQQIEIRQETAGPAALTNRGLLPIPAAIRRPYGLRPGDQALLAATGNHLTVYPLTTLHNALAHLIDRGER